MTFTLGVLLKLEMLERLFHAENIRVRHLKLDYWQSDI